MGQAKGRGSRDERVAEATRLRAQVRPPVIRCNACSAELHAVEPMDTTGLKGIELAFRAHCEPCDQDTWAVRGDAAAVRAFYEALEKSVGQKVRLGTTRPALDD